MPLLLCPRLYFQQQGSAQRDRFSQCTSIVPFFLSDPTLSKRWIVNIRRDISEPFVLNKHAKVCSLHFAEDSYYRMQSENCHSNRSISGQKHRRVKPGATSMIFPWSPILNKQKVPTEHLPLPSKWSCEQVRLKLVEEGAFGEKSSGDSDDLDILSEPCVASGDVYTHTHCECVESLVGKVEALECAKGQIQEKCAMLEEENTAPREAERALSKHRFRINNIKDNDDLVKFYTGFHCFCMYFTCFSFLC